MIKTLGFKSGFGFYQIGNQVFKGDYADDPKYSRFLCYVSSWPLYLKTYGPLFDYEGNEIKE